MPRRSATRNPRRRTRSCGTSTSRAGSTGTSSRMCASCCNLAGAVVCQSATTAQDPTEGVWLQVRSFKRLREGLSEISGPRTLAGMLWRTLTARTSWLLKAAEVSSYDGTMCLAEHCVHAEINSDLKSASSCSDCSGPQHHWP